MVNKARLRSVAAVGIAMVVLVTMTDPAAAAVHNSTITGGSLTSTKTGVTEVITLGGLTSCEATTLSADFGTETQGGTYSVTFFGHSHVQPYSNGQSYLTMMTRSTTGNIAGTWTSSTGTTHSMTSNRVAFTSLIFNTTSCSTSGNPPICSVAVLLSLNSTFPSSISVSNTFTATGTSVGTVVAFPTCPGGPSQILGTALTTTTGITGTITT